jgi:hypothetical protein
LSNTDCFIGRQFYENKIDSDGWDDSGWQFGSGPNYSYTERVNGNSTKFDGDTWCRHADHNSWYTESDGAKGDSRCYDYAIDNPVDFDAVPDNGDSSGFHCYTGGKHCNSEC